MDHHYRWLCCLLQLAFCLGFENDLAERLLRVTTHRKLSNDDFYSVDDYAANDDANDDHYVSYNSDTGVDLTSYALKYVGCQNIHVWDSQNAAESPLRLSRMVMLRLCEASGCSNYNARGCQRNYAEYILPMDDYVEIMKDYHFEKLTRYCNVCADCMTFSVTPTQAPTASGDDFYSAGDDDTYQANSNYYNNGGRMLANNYYGYYNVNDDANANDDGGNNNNNNNNQNALPWYIDSDGQCIYSTVCEYYKSTCATYKASLFSDDDASRANIYTSCTATDTQYVAPHCGSDGHSIELGVYADAYCSNYLQRSSSGYSFDAYSSKKCLLCNAAQSFSLVSDKDIAASKVSSNPLCSAFYDTSAKCNTNMMSSYKYSTSSGYYDYNGAQTQVVESEEANEEGVCSYIEGLLENNYNDNGEVVVEDEFDPTHWNQGSEYAKIIRKASTSQLMALFVSMGTAFGLAIYSAYLHRKLTRRKPWIPPKDLTRMESDDPKYLAGRLSRRNSGINAARSSDSSAYIPYGASVPSKDWDEGVLA